MVCVALLARLKGGTLHGFKKQILRYSFEKKFATLAGLLPPIFQRRKKAEMLAFGKEDGGRATIWKQRERERDSYVSVLPLV